MENKDALIKALKDLIYYGDGLKSTGTYMTELHYYVKYVDSVKEYMKKKSSDKVIMKEMDNIPFFDEKEINTKSVIMIILSLFISIFSLYSVYKANKRANEVLDYIDTVNSTSERLIVYLKLAE